MPDEQEELYDDFLDGWEDLVFQTIFDLEKKYTRLLKQRAPLSTKESEADRSKVSDAYKYLTEINWHIIDASLYSDFVAMHTLRTQLTVDKDVTKMERFADFARFVQRSCRPIVFTLASIGTKSIVELLSDHEGEKKIELENEEVSQFKEKYKRMHKLLKTKFMSIGEKMEQEKALIERLKNQTLSKQELEKSLTAFEAELLSKLISEKKLIAEVQGEFLTFKVKRKSKKSKEALPASLLLNPTKKQKKRVKNE